MSNVFSLNRFLLLARGHFRKNLKAYIVSSVVFAGVTLGLFYFIMSSKRMSMMSAGDQFAVYIMVIFGGLFIFSASVFQPFQDRREGMFQLMLPASQLEKFLLAWTTSIIGYTVCAHGIFFLVRYGVLQYAAVTGYQVADFFDNSRFEHFNGGASLVMVIVYFLVHAFALVGSLMFRKLSVLKTALSLLLVVVGYGAFIRTLFNVLFPQEATTTSLLPFTPVNVGIDESSYTVTFSGWPYAASAFAIFIIGLLWFTAYHKLCEKEV